MKKEEYIKKWLNDALTKEEKLQFEQTEDFRSIERISNAVKYFAAPKYDGKEQFKAQKIQDDGKLISIKPNYAWLKIAASVILVLGVLYFMIGNSTFDLNKDAISYLTLPDESTVTLNKRSDLEFDAENWQTSRTAFLKGEGFFEVSQGKKFDIKSASGTVSVLGTAFNIKDRPGFYEVNCHHGKVKVVAGNEEAVLTANQSFRLIDGKAETLSYDSQEKPGWLNGNSLFKSVPYIQVVMELERQYSVSIDTGNIDINQRFTGGFTHSDLNLALKSITIPLNGNFSVVGAQVKLSSDKP